MWLFYKAHKSFLLRLGKKSNSLQSKYTCVSKWKLLQIQIQKKNSNLTFYIMQLHIVRWGINTPPPLKTPPMFFRQPHPSLNLQNVQAPSFWAIPSYILLFCGNTPPPWKLHLSVNPHKIIKFFIIKTIPSFVTNLIVKNSQFKF